MPKQNKRCASRQCKGRMRTDDDRTATIVHELTKTANRYSPFQREGARRTESSKSSDTIKIKEVTSTLTTRKHQHHHPQEGKLANGIIESGIKYIMLPLHLLHFCIFGTSISPPATETTKVASVSSNVSASTSSSRPAENSKLTEKSVRDKGEEVVDFKRREDACVKYVEERCAKSAKSTRVDPKEIIDATREDEARDKRDDEARVKRTKEDEGRSTSREKREESRKESSERKKALIENRKNNRSPVSSSSSSSSSSFSTTSSSKRTKRSDQRDSSPSVTRNEKSPKKKMNENSEDSDEMVTAAEDSDSSNDQWSSANSTMNMSLDQGNFLERSMFDCECHEEPMDISIDESFYTERNSGHRVVAKSSLPRETWPVKITSKGRNQESSPGSTNSSDSEAISLSSVDEEIARIFRKKCTSSDDEASGHSGRGASGPSRRVDGRQSNPYSREDRGEWRRRTPVRGTHSKEVYEEADSKERKRFNAEDDAREKKKKSATREDNRGNSKQNSPGKSYRSRLTRTPSKSKETQRKEVKYKERATQTDSAFSDEDVEMIPIDPRMSEKRVFNRSVERRSRTAYQVEAMDHDLDYVADNEDSNDGCLKLARSRISSSSTSSSSTDLGFEERGWLTPDAISRFVRWQSFSSDAIKTTQRVVVTRAPPGFPQFPQNPPASSCNCGYPDCFILPVTISNDQDDNHPRALDSQVGQNYPPAPNPMKHLYHEYPEFMVAPEDIHASKMLRDIFENGYRC